MNLVTYWHIAQPLTLTVAELKVDTNQKSEVHSLRF